MIMYIQDSADGVLAGSSSDSEGGGGGGGGKKKKKRRKKNKSSGQLQESRRDRSVQFALGDLFTQLHAEVSPLKRCAVCVYVCLSQKKV